MIANPNDGNSPQVEQATPSISVSSGGLITAKTEQEKGYVPGGTKSSTKQLPTQAAKTVTPGTSNQTAVASGRYTTGDVVVAGDANLVPANIAQGVSIFGVTGTHSGGTQLESVSISVSKTDGLYSILSYYSTVNGFTESAGNATDCLKDSMVLLSTSADTDIQLSGNYEVYGVTGPGYQLFVCMGNVEIVITATGPV